MAICGDDMIRTQLKEMKDRSGLTNKELSELSGVPLSTVSKIMSGHTDIPNYQTVCDLVKAMGGSLDALAGIRPAEEAGPERAEESSEIKLYIQMIEEKNRWLKRLFVICCILMTVIVGILLFDYLHPTIGFIQR